MRHLPLAVLTLAAITATACRQAPSLDALPSQELAGRYTASAAGSWFRPCTLAPTDSGWWVTFADRAVTQRDSLRQAGVLRDGAPLFVRWRAAVVEDGRIGPRGPGVPALLVREVLAARPPAAGDCGA